METRQTNRKKLNNRMVNISRNGTQPWVQRLRHRQNYSNNSTNASTSNNYYYRQNEQMSSYYGRNNYGRQRFNYNHFNYYSNSNNNNINNINNNNDDNNDNNNELQPVMNTSHPVSFQIVNYEMCFYCFDVLHCHLFPNIKQANFETAFTDDPYPIFVTWKIGKEKRLRGCIGTFQPISLHRGLREYALSSAFRDSRFSPISASELCHLHVCVSILLNFETGNNFMDWQLGVHGIRIEFKNENGSKRSACYLPEVPVEQGWNKTQTIDSLLRKGGYRMHITEAFRYTIILNRFTTEKISVNYDDYMRYVSNTNNNNNNHC